MATIDLNTATITGLSESLRTGTLSPVDLVTVTLERIDALQPTLQCFTTVTPELALRRARDAEREMAKGQYRGPLHGIPYTLKDVVATQGIRTTFGDPKGTDYAPKANATLYSLLDAAGGILVGKVVSEIGRDALGPVGCRNPWNPQWSPGTSSSGSGAAVAASLGLASIGTDTGGSVRHPASNSGVVGMKATFGRISRFGVWAASWSTDQAGPLTKTVEDNALLLEILGEYDPQDPVSLNEPRYPYRANLRAGIKGLRIGVPADAWVWTDWLSDEEEQVVRTAIQVLETLGASLVEVHLPRAAEARAILSELVSEAPVYLDDHFTSEQIEAWPEHHGSRERGRAQPFADYLHAQQQRALIGQEAVAVLKQVDVIAMPTGSTFGDEWNAETVVIRGRERTARSRAVYRNALASLTGHPALSIPCGFGLNDTFPIGLMLQGRPLEEARLYQVAYAYEQGTEWHKRHPPLLSDSPPSPMRPESFQDI
jgi:Asp-tRNA(Asn)/Glu-tRNA(Gln) amidotransferase A subunit family amidase